MPDATFREESQDGSTRYTCIIPYATQPGGICGHWSTDFTLFRQHMEQQHQGLLVRAGEAPSHPSVDPDAPEPSHPAVDPEAPAPGHPLEEPDAPEPTHPVEEPDAPAPTPQATSSR